MEASMTLSRRDWLRTALFGTVAATTGPALAQSPRASMTAALGTLGLEAAQFGLRPGAAEDQSRTLQAALVEATKRE
eukprot:gene30925-39822_t